VRVPLLDSSEKEAIALAAVRALREALTAGYDSLDSLQADRDLDALRGRDDFKEIMAGLPRAPAGGP
jgi:hypothetical protein